MNLHDLQQQWDQSVQNLQAAVEDHGVAASELSRQLDIRTSLSAGMELSWKKNPGNSDQVCQYWSDGTPTYRCQSCTGSWTYSSPC